MKININIIVYLAVKLISIAKYSSNTQSN